MRASAVASLVSVMVGLQCSAVEPVRRVAIDVGGDPGSSAIMAVACGDELAFSDVPTRIVFTRGTPGSTREVATPFPPERAVSVDRMIEFNHAVIYSACSLDAEYLVRTDGTEAGTRVLMVVPGQVSEHSISSLTASGSYAYYMIGRQNRELWRTDGTPEGTVRLAQVSIDYILPRPSGVWCIQATTRGYPPVRTTSLWESDGTPAGTRLVPGWNHSPLGAVMMDQYLCVMTSDVAGTASVWMTESGQTWNQMATSIPGQPWLVSRGLEPDSLFVETVVLGRHYMWDMRADGSRRQVLTSLLWGPWEIMAARGRAFFWVWTGTASELWSSDGASSGLISPDLRQVNSSALIAHGSRVYFQANDGVNGRELWSTDGTAMGTRMVANIMPGRGSGMPGSGPIVSVHSRLYFQAQNGVLGQNLWVLNTCPADFNNDGVVGLQDVFAFLSSFFSGEDLADFDGSGVVNTGDLFGWLTSWFEGCDPEVAPHR